MSDKCAHFFYGNCPIIKQENEELISDILEDLEEFELKRYSDMIRTLKKIREKLEGKLK